MNLKALLNKKELTTNDLKTWETDFSDVEKIFDTVKDRDLQGIIDKFRHIAKIDITSDTQEPLEFIDFNYGSLCCTISIYNDENKPMLLYDDIQGYIRRDGIELEGYYEFNINDVRELIK